jgi:Rad3-related DNA helicase
MDSATDTPLVQIEQPKLNLQNNPSTQIRDHFPFPTMRAAQDKALTAVENAYQNNKKFIIIEAPTGIGKSGIAIAAASHAQTVIPNGGRRPGGYILSPQKTLTAQYMNDFSNLGLLEMKGKANYWCAEHNVDCDTGALINNSEHQGDDREVCPFCPYKIAKKATIESMVSTMNFAYFLNETQYAGQLGERNMLVLDEGHNTESQVLGFTDTEITRKRSDEVGTGAMPFFKPGENEKCYTWLVDVFRPACIEYMQQLQDLCNEAKYSGDREETIKYARKLDSYDKYTCRLNRFINSNDRTNWLCWTDKDTKATVIKPLTATLYADDVLFRKGDKILMMSATILDFPTVMRNLGINPADAECLALDSEFPLENRPIFFRPVGSMSHSSIEETLPKLSKMVGRILAQYATKKGIVHTHSYRITKYLVDWLNSNAPEQRFRIITHDSTPGSRDAAVVQHFESPDPTVLFSPSMTEGLDLKEDLSRFQVLCKVPYPYLSPYIRARLDRDQEWYNWCTGLTMVQASGRSIRNKTDKAHTYILDSAFEYFLAKYGNKLPKWWTDAIQF